MPAPPADASAWQGHRVLSRLRAKQPEQWWPSSQPSHSLMAVMTAVSIGTLRGVCGKIRVIFAADGVINCRAHF